jgi:hypothetical protein
LVENLHGRRVDRVASEIAEEISMFLKYLHSAASAREEQRGHHPGWPATDNNEVRIS